jgi:hypothetical protein
MGAGIDNSQQAPDKASAAITALRIQELFASD